MTIMLATIGNETEDPSSYAFQIGEIGVVTHINDRCVLTYHCVMTDLSFFI